LLDGAKVISGPATKALPAVSLTMDGEFLAIAQVVSPTPGQ
jgi:Rieske Fe-S protein